MYVQKKSLMHFLFRIIVRLLPKAPVISVIEVTPDLVRFQVSFRGDDGSTLKLLVVKPFQRELKYKNYPIGKKRELHVPFKKLISYSVVEILLALKSYYDIPVNQCILQFSNILWWLE